MAKHITEQGAKAVRKAAEASPLDTETVPGPSSNPATNLLITDIAMRSGGRIMRMAMEKGLLRTKFDPELATEIIESRTLGKTLITYGISKIATRSLPGAALVGGGLLLRTLFDRSQTKRKSRRAGEKALKVQKKEK